MGCACVEFALEFDTGILVLSVLLVLILFLMTLFVVEFLTLP